MFRPMMKLSKKKLEKKKKRLEEKNAELAEVASNDDMDVEESILPS